MAYPESLDYQIGQLEFCMDLLRQVCPINHAYRLEDDEGLVGWQFLPLTSSMRKLFIIVPLTRTSVISIFI